MRKIPQITGIYKIESPSESVYIGLSRHILKRWWNYKNPANKYLKSSIDKYGKDAHKFEVVHELPNDVSDEVLKTYEIIYGEQYKAIGFKMFNTSDFGGIPPNHKGRTLPDRVRKNMAGCQKGSKKKRVIKTAWNSGLKGVSEETKQLMSKAAKGKIVSQETRDKISRTTKGRPQTEAYKENHKVIMKKWWDNRRLNSNI